jgi:uncharacterized protein (DUF3820 family)
MSEMTTLFKKEVRKYTTQVFQNFNELAPKTPIDNDPFDFGVNPGIRPSPQGSFKPKFVSEDETVFLENYANPLSSLTMLRKTLVIEENENKIALKCYNYRNHRDVAKKYFIVRRDITYLTFNIKRKTFYSGILRLKKRAKIGSKMSMNKTDLYSMDVYNQIFYFMSYLNNEYDSYNLTNEVINLFLNRVSEIIDIKFDKEDLTPRDKFYQLYLKISGIKYPDAFSKFVTYYTPKKEIREHGNNLVTWFMKKNGFKGTKIRELLNKYNNVDINGLTSFYKLLGQNLFNTINSECFLTESKLGSEYYGMWSQIPEMLGKKELYNICKILNTTKSETLLNSLGDHIHYKESLKKYGEFVKITATNYDDYVKEHSEWSSLIQSYRTGLVTRFYGDDEYLIEKPINHNGETYYPVLLKTTEQYEGESMVQSNCVRTYSEKPYCFIVSLRKGSVDSEVRASIELRYMTDGLKVVQKLGKYNKHLSEEWLSPINELEGFANYLYSKGIIKLPEMTKKFPNGKSVKTYSVFENNDLIKNMFPVWSDGYCLQVDQPNYNLFEDIDLF